VRSLGPVRQGPEASQHAVAFRWEEWILKLGILAQRPAPRLASRL
jgi:hypothetical protein